MGDSVAHGVVDRRVREIVEEDVTEIRPGVVGLGRVEANWARDDARVRVV